MEAEVSFKVVLLGQGMMLQQWSSRENHTSLLHRVDIQKEQGGVYMSS